MYDQKACFSETTITFLYVVLLKKLVFY